MAFSPVIHLSEPGEIGQPEAIEWYRSCKGGKTFQPGVYHLQLELEKPRSGIDPEAWYVLIFPSINGAALRVHLDGSFLGSQGDFARGQSSIWNSAKAFPIQPGLLHVDAKMQIEILGMYEAGIIKQPYVMELGAARPRLVYLSFMSEQLVWLMCGAILVMGLAIMAIGYSSSKGLDGRMVLGFAAVCTGFFLADFLTFEYLPLSLLAFKKIVVVLRHLAAILFIHGFLRLLGRKLDWFAKVFSVVQLVCAGLAFLPATVVALKGLYTYTYLTILPFQFYLLYLLYHTRQEGPGRRLLLVGVSVGVVSAMHDILITLIIPNSILISHIGFMVLTLATTAFVVSDIMQNYRQLVIEQNRAEAYREASLHDPLTGVFNRGILPLVRENLPGPFAVLLADLDDFKSINDRYGHLVGDRVLMDLVSVMARVFRRGDFLVRTGGDEFLAILPACPLLAIDDLKAKLVSELARSRISVHDTMESQVEVPDRLMKVSGDTVISYSASIGSAHYSGTTTLEPEQFEALIAEADSKLYEVKRNPNR
jgi:diguanylate cyclase (GGDEF)-like protein